MKSYQSINPKVTFLIIIIFFCGFSLWTSNFDKQSKLIDIAINPKIDPTSSSNYTIHEPIYIDETNPDHDWDNVPGITGLGTKEDPFLINNFEIYGQNTNNCIELYHITKYLNITNCFLYNSLQWNSYTKKCIDIYNCTNIGISQNFIRGGERSVMIRQGNNITVWNNTIKLSYGELLYMQDCYNSSVFQNWLMDSQGNGLHLTFLYYSSVFENVITQNGEYGLIIEDSYTDNITNNFIVNNHQPKDKYDWDSDVGIGIYMRYAQKIEIKENILINNSIQVRQPSSQSSIDPTNLVNNKPIYFFAYQSNLTISNLTNIGQIILSSCENISIDSINLEQSGSIEVADSKQIKVQNCTITNSFRGISYTYVENGSISKNTIIGEQILVGISLGSGTQNITIQDNIIRNVIFGMMFDQVSYCKVNRNQHFYCKYGIQIYWALNISIEYNEYITTETLIHTDIDQYYTAINNRYSNNVSMAYNLIRNYQTGIKINSGKNLSIYNNNLYRTTFSPSVVSQAFELFSEFQNSKIEKNQIVNYTSGIRMDYGFTNNNLITNNNFSLIAWLCMNSYHPANEGILLNNVTLNFIRYTHGILFTNTTNPLILYNNILEPVLPSAPIFITGNLTVISTNNNGYCKIEWLESDFAESYVLYFNSTKIKESTSLQVQLSNADFKSRNSTFEVIVRAHNNLGDSEPSIKIILQYIFINTSYHPPTNSSDESDFENPFQLNGYPNISNIIFIGICVLFVRIIQKRKKMSLYPN